MTTEQQQSDRDFERQALYNQYVAYSKAAARMLWILLAFSVYLGYAYSDRRGQFIDAVAEWEDAVKHWNRVYMNIKDLPFCPARKGTEAYSAPIDYATLLIERRAITREKQSPPRPQFESQFRTKYTLPIIALPISGTLFLFMGPILLAFLTVVYWSYLRKCRKLPRLASGSPGNTDIQMAVQYPWVYNVPLGTPRIGAILQVALETLPIIIFGAVVFGAFASVGRSSEGIANAFWVAFGFTLGHSRMFRVPVGTVYRDKGTFQSLMFMAVAGILLAISVPFTSLDPNAAIPYLHVWVFWFGSVVSISFLEFVFFERPYFSIIPLLPIFLLRFLGLLLTRRGRTKNAEFWTRTYKRLKRGPRLSGYYLYFRHRHYELKDLERNN